MIIGVDILMNIIQGPGNQYELLLVTQYTLVAIVLEYNTIITCTYLSRPVSLSINTYFKVSLIRCSPISAE